MIDFINICGLMALVGIVVPVVIGGAAFAWMWCTDAVLRWYGQQKAVVCWIMENSDRINAWPHRRLRLWCLRKR